MWSARHLYVAPVLKNRYLGTVNICRENWLEAAFKFVDQQGRLRGARGFAKVGDIALDLTLPFVSSEGVPGPFEFDGLEAFVAVVPHAQ